MKKFVFFGAMVGAAMLYSSAAQAQCGDGENRRITIINETGGTITNFYGSAPDTTSWEEDILGNSVIGPYDKQVINFDNSSCRCIFDFKAVYNDRADAIRYKINVCKIGSYRYHD